jgi:GTP 3',8-cyclase
MLRTADRIDSAAPTAGPALRDGYGRRFAYLRLSVTDRCNFRCAYCLPNGYQKVPGAPSELTLAEMTRLVRGFAALGVTKLRLTGGEPTVRADFAESIAAMAAVPGITRLAMTTNGYRLARDAALYADAGMHSVNVSVDSLDADEFARITGHDKLAEVLRGVEAARAAGMAVKLNAVLMRGVNDGDLDRFIAFVQERGLTLRFIETMQTGDNQALFGARHRPGAFIAAELEQRGWQVVARGDTDGPAVTYAPPAGDGRIGLILPYGPDFCASCNRLRLSATGRLHLCLFGEGGHDLRDLAQEDAQLPELSERIQAILPLKAEGHRLAEGHSGATRHFASIGG